MINDEDPGLNSMLLAKPPRLPDDMKAAPSSRRARHVPPPRLSTPPARLHRVDVAFAEQCTRKRGRSRQVAAGQLVPDTPELGRPESFYPLQVFDLRPVSPLQLEEFKSSRAAA